MKEILSHALDLTEDGALDLFAEELPAGAALQPGCCYGNAMCVATFSTTTSCGASCASTFSTISCECCNS